MTEESEMSSFNRPALEARWLHLTRVALPAVAGARGWPIVADHCFQRVFLDVATGGVWYDAIPRRPAYANASDAVLAEAVRLAEAVLAGRADLVELNQRSLAWRRARRAR
jgi:hypothetical protein